VFEYEGILHPDGVYKPKQFSNEWLMWTESKPYSYIGPDGPINRIHPSLMGDFYPYFNGCHFYSTAFKNPGPRSRSGAANVLRAGVCGDVGSAGLVQLCRRGEQCGAGGFCAGLPDYESAAGD
jgi:hypothetical protein